MKLKEYRNLAWPTNLWSSVLQKKVTEKELPADWEKVLKYVFGERIDAKKAEIVLYYFRDGMTFQEVGDIYGLTLETIRQHASKAIRTLRHPSRRVFLIYGLEKGKMVLAEEQAAAEHRRLDGNLIENLDLSVRSYNCLKRAGINTVEQLSQCSDEDLARLRNLGARSLQEIKDCLASIRGESNEQAGSEQEQAAGVISRKALIDAVEKIDWYSVGKGGELHEGAKNQDCAFIRYTDVEAVIKAAPEAQATPTRRGQWKRVGQVCVDGEYVDVYRCGKCSIPHDKQSRYCPNCGAQMGANK